ncbi:MAG: pyridoxal phosphate-dependent aminotransferase [Synergistaceae bacterium]|nr:pyridoxal phosphate-dependent aminotransferase [Synergistaceae bacterium]
MEKNARISKMPPAGGLYDVFQKALKLKAEGKRIVHMEIGKPDFASPPKANEAVKEALDNGFVHYTEMAGIPNLRKAIADKELKKNDLVVNPEDEIVVTAGACEAISTIFLSYFSEGDECIILSPYFSAYKEIAVIAGVELIEVPLTIDNNFAVDIDEICKAVNEKTRGIIINTPNNPTGQVMTLDELKQIAELAKEKDLLIISDETYDQFLFEGEHKSIYGLEGMKERTLLVNSLSKTFSMTGWRIGYVIGKAEYIKTLTKIHQNLSTCATSFAQVGAAVALNECDQFTLDMVEEFRQRRDIIVAGLKEIPGVECNTPMGAFYVFPRISGTGLTSMEFCELILDYGVAAVPGTAFGADFEGYVRFCYACSQEDIKWALEQIKKAIEEKNK